MQLYFLSQLFPFHPLLSKSVLFTKSDCFNLAGKLSAVNLLNSGVVIYLS